MKKLYLFFAMLWVGVVSAQTLTIVSPEGLSEPYEVEPNTAVTFQWDYFQAPPTAYFSYDQEPNFASQPGTDPAWTQLTGFTDNGDGTYNFTMTITDEVYIWAGVYNSWFGSYSFSNVFHFQVNSGVIISDEDGFICPGGEDTELLTVTDTFPSYQWYQDGAPIEGAVSATYAATVPGSYKVQVPLDGDTVFSNTLIVGMYAVSLTASYNSDNSILTLLASEGFETYQWYSGTDSINMNPVSGATSDIFAATLPDDTMYYAVEATSGTCTVMSAARKVIPETFVIPELHLSADTNSYGYVCDGTPVSLWTNAIFTSYQWLNNGNETYLSGDSIVLTQTYQAGNYTVRVSPVGWPEILLESESVAVSFYAVTAPALFSDDGDNKYCPGQTVNLTLSDEGYDYEWYVYSGDSYDENDMVNVPGATYTFTYESNVKVTVVGTYQGCSAITTLMLNSWENQQPFISLDDYTGNYLCTDSTEILRVSPFNAANYSNYQWGVWSGGSFQPIADSILSSITIGDTGVYVVQASPVACPTVTVTSNTVHIQSYLDRPLFIYADPELICVGDTTELHISGGYEWQDIQWFKQYIDGFSPNDEQFNPLIGAGSEATQEVTGLYRYRAKARYVGCPTGQKITSNTVSIRPKVNPGVAVHPDYGISSVNAAPFDSIQQRVFCVGETVDLSVPEYYNGYSWLITQYSAINYYTPGGDPIPDENSDSLAINDDGAYWITAMVDSAGCLGYSDPILIDHWVFLAPAIQSYGNSELCSPGDSVLLNLGFGGDWISFQWFNDGVPIPNSNNDSIYATEPGMYVIEAVPALCPSFAISSGVGPVVSFLQASIVENDTVIYALPQLGYYTYQWFLDGEPIEAPATTPWLLYKDEMANGVYTVAVTNPDSCTSVSDPFLWQIDGIEDLVFGKLSLYPNPTTDMVVISGIDLSLIKNLKLYDTLGKEYAAGSFLNDNKLNVGGFPPGAYLLRIELKNGHHAMRKLIKN